MHIFAETDATRMRADGYAEFDGHQHDGEVFMDASYATAVDLADVDGLGLHELLEEDAILAVFAGGDAHAGNFAADAGVAEHVVGAGGFFHPPGIELLELAGAEDGFFDIPLLIGVHHEAVGGADFFADEASAPMIVGGIAADFELEVGPAFGEGFVAEAGDFLVAESDPTG